IATTEPTLRDMLQQFRHLFDHVVYGDGSREAGGRRQESGVRSQESGIRNQESEVRAQRPEVAEEIRFKHVEIVETRPDQNSAEPLIPDSCLLTPDSFLAPPEPSVTIAPTALSSALEAKPSSPSH